MKKILTTVLIISFPTFFFGCTESLTTTEKGAIIGTGAGASLGAVIGSATGNAGAGAGIGAVVGLIGGALIGDQIQERQKQEQELKQQITNGCTTSANRPGGTRAPAIETAGGGAVEHRLCASILPLNSFENAS
jgi:uncharacterized protein YcfJ